MAGSWQLLASDLNLFERRSPAATLHCTAAAGRVPEISWNLELLARYGGNKTEAAKEFGVNRTTLWRWMSRC
jgi:transcriptional regulator with PAS, ATPase and Fis domain